MRWFSIKRSAWQLAVGVVLSFTLAPITRAQSSDLAVPAVQFGGGYGQVEVGGPYAGAEFHGSRPLPARISFYYPVANSIDRSTDYWQRGDSRPWHVGLRVDGQEEALGEEAWAYTWSPAGATFERRNPRYHAEMSYRFAEDLPLMAWQLTLTNESDEAALFEVDTRLQIALRTSHAYAHRDTARVRHLGDGSTFVADFLYRDTDSTQVFVIAPGAAVAPGGQDESLVVDPAAVFTYRQTVQPGGQMELVQLVGTARARESGQMLEGVRLGWRESVRRYERRVAEHARRQDRMALDDEALVATARQARVLLQANAHYLDGQVVPMPCPAEYNFFFTHDLLLTDLGAVRFDAERVRRDLRHVHRLARADSTIPHAYYWRDGAYVTEFAGTSNWNHLWFILVASTYLKHTDDTSTLDLLAPLLEKSMNVMLTNEQDGLMHARYPDWWDIGNVYGARAYITALMIRALESFVAVSVRMGWSEGQRLTRYLEAAGRMREQLVGHLWDDETGYLLNELEHGVMDRHYYAGSLVAAMFGQLDPERRATLLETARRELLDDELGIRVAMPADFDERMDEYRFNGPEVGAPFRYLNGGVWPHGTAWYVMALLADDRPDDARGALHRYLSLDGIRRSPNGQPAFYEYRFADPAHPEYGAVDKPTFLWAGGWFLHALYGLMGVRENAWNLYLDPHLPSGYDTLAYDVVLPDGTARIAWAGKGETFREIRVDGRPVPSAVLSGAASRIDVVRGEPRTPYLAEAEAVVDEAYYDPGRGVLHLGLRGVPHTVSTLRVVSPTSPSAVHATKGKAEIVRCVTEATVVEVELSVRLSEPRTTVEIYFQP